MADSFFGFDTSVSNINDDEGGGGPSEDEYDALNDETFGQDSDTFDWEAEHELVASQLESSRRSNAANAAIETTHCRQLEASISQLVLDEPDAPQSRTLGSAVWRHDLPFGAPTPLPILKNVCTVEEIERQLRQKQPQQQTQVQQQQGFQQNYYQPRFTPVILQRPPGLQAPVPLPFVPQQNMAMSQMNNIMGQNNQGNMLGQNMNQMGQNVNQIGQNANQFMANANQITFQNNQMKMQANQLMGQNINMSQKINQMGPNMNQNANQMAPNINHMGQNMNQIGPMVPNVNQMGQNINNMGQMNQNMNQMGQNVNQMMPNGNQFPPMNQFPHMMGQPRMMGPPPGMNMPRQNFNPGMGQFNHSFRAKADQPLNQQNMMMNHQMLPQQLQSQPMPITTSGNQTTHLNHQSPQSKQSNAQKTPNRIEPKQQKSRVYNNSNLSNSFNSKNLTSQNMVQIIQSTHPMLQFNNSFHNANHHPMLNRNNSAFCNLFGNHQMFNQRHNGSFNDSLRLSLNGDDASTNSDGDEYAGLMTQREKQWLINIQMLQLNSGTPYIHDFYYTVFLERKANKEKEGVKEAHKANQQNHPFYSGAVNKSEAHSHGRERHNSNRHNSTSEDSATPRTYVPTQFENSLGKLQCGSVTAPRKIIDLEVVAGEAPSARVSRAPSVASTTNPSEVPRELKKTKQLLLDIEALYLILLRLEELNDPLAISNALILKEREEKQKHLEALHKEIENEPEDESNVFLRNIESVHRRPKQDSPKGETVDKRQVVNLAVNQKPPAKNLLDEDKDELLNKMFAGLLHSDRVQQMLGVRKGRCLIARFVRRSPSTHPLARALWSRVLRALPNAARRCQDDAGFAQMAAPYRKYIQSSTGWPAILESCGILSEALDPARTPHVLTSSLTLSCVCAMVEKAATLVTTPDATANERHWFKFLKTTARALKNATVTVARPVQPLTEHRVTQHVKQLESRSTVEILQRGKAAEFADLTKSDVSEQLIRHLCN